MTNTYDLTQLDANSFENMVNFLAIRVLGKGVSGFAPGADGGRDGYFKGEAPYPSDKNKWSGIWFIQSKFHKPHLSTNAQKWLIGQVKEEIQSFLKPNARKLPENWIIATNIDPSGVPETGAYDQIQKLVKKELGKDIRFDIWGGRKILDFLAADPAVANHYGHFLTPGNVLTSLYEKINDSSSQVKSIIEHLVVGQFNEQIYTKLEQAGSSADTRPKIYELFVDLPFYSNSSDCSADILCSLVSSSANVHKISAWNQDRDCWVEWNKAPKRSRILVLKGGPGQGKSTAGQYFAQIQRAALILGEDGPHTTPKLRGIAEQFRAVALKQGFWSEVPRIPITIELKDFATWYGQRNDLDPRGVLSYISDKIKLKTEQLVEVGTLKRAFSARSWFVNFDGLDEVPNDVKDSVAEEIIKFTEETLPLLDADVLTLCTTRPQGYSGQFDKLDASIVSLADLPSSVALACASAVVRFDRSEAEADYAVRVLESAMESAQVLELMTTPLQSHIMAVVVRDGGRPPEKRWELFDNFYKVMKKRESQKNFQDLRIAKLLREGDTLLKAIHTRLGIVLHSAAEISTGAETTLKKSDFEILARKTTAMLIDENVDEVVDALMEATIERLVFVNTPESSSTVRFDIRQLQEFFAGEFIYLDVSQDTMRSRLETICTDAHWREVMHFTLSALVANARPTELGIASNVLSNADNSGNCHKSKLFNKRMAVGALLGLRLLTEGVLEQDKRLRHQFLNVLIPLYAMLDVETISALAEVKHTNSNAWLINAMIDHVFEGSEPECIGAALALVSVLPGDHPRTSDVFAKLQKSSNNFLEIIYRLQLQSDRRIHTRRTPYEYKSAQRWFIVFTLELVLTSEIREGLDYSLLVNFLTTHSFALYSTDEFQKLSILETKLLFALLEDNTSKTVNSKQQRNPYKGMTLSEYEHTWANGKIPDFMDVRSLPPVGDHDLGPILSFVHSIIIFTNCKSHENFSRLVERALKLTPARVSKILPTSLSALIPLSPWSEDDHRQLSYLQSLSTTEFDRFIATGKLKSHNVLPTSASISITGQFSKSGWKNTCRDFPALALDIWMQDIGHNHEQFQNHHFSSAIEEILIAHYEVAGKYILHWGKLFGSLPDQGKKLRKALASKELSGVSDYYPQTTTTPFLLDLKDELSWLPIIAAALIGRLYYGPKTKDHFFFNRSERHSSMTLDAFGLTDVVMRDLYSDKGQSNITRCAALAIYLSQVFSETDNAREMFYNRNLDLIIITLLHADTPAWFITSVFMFCEKHLSHDDQKSIELIGHCFELYRDNYRVRAMMQGLLKNWRERSSAPVDNKKVLDQWLEQTL
jgi:hypothetical protein